MTKTDLQEELKKSMLAKDETRVSVLRLLLSAINYYEINKGGAGYEATDEDVLSVIQKEAKQRRDSIEEFKKGGRQDLVDKEAKELEILNTYLPEQMDEEEIKKLVENVISQTSAKTIADMGKLMGALMPKIKGKADGNLVSKIVRKKLS
ncbi:MAG: GatB/YqeY domain-containing protein [Candidatus Levybacteria bacterium]|nr:GatB/YqeY domain-containing protein [Candidatus Levybacteria bacterium]